MSEPRELGIVVGTAKPDQVTFEARRPVSIGEYVVLSYSRGRVLGLVDRSVISSDALHANIRNFDEASESRQVAMENSRDKSFRATSRLLGLLDELNKCKTVIPALPPEPGTQVFETVPEDLMSIFSPQSSEWARIGTLLRNTQVDAKVNINKVVSRHLAVLAMTGMGKSNLVSLLAKEVAKISGTMVIFDYHDDYSLLDVGGKGNIMDARINPRLLQSDKLADIIEIQENASNQRHVLREALTEEVKKRKGDEFWSKLLEGVDAVAAEDKSYREAAGRVSDKIDDARRRFQNILDAGIDDPLAMVKNGKINVINLVELTERQANIVVSFYLEQLLDDRKLATRAAKGAKKLPRFPAPVLVVIEEAHVFVPRDEDTATKYYASKVAREGRKFGLGLVIVSQRPRGIDSNILSQMGSLAVMRMIQQDDQAHVSAASEALSRDLIDQLTSLNPGEAIFAGQWVNLPTFVRVEEVKDRRTGSDQKAVEAWRQLDRIREVSKEPSDSYIPTGYIQD